jgi:putative hemolysin
LKIIEEEGYSRLPVYEKRLDNIIGTIHVKDLIPWILKKKKPSLRQILRPPYFIPESATLENILRRMQATKNHLMYIVDEYGNFEGIVTMEDIIEEIVGEIQDEYDKELEELIREEGNGVFLVRGRTPIKELKQKVPIDIPYRGYFTTVAGFFLSIFGQIPQEGDEIMFGGYRITVVKMSGRLIQLLRFTPESRTIKSSDESNRHQ